MIGLARLTLIEELLGLSARRFVGRATPTGGIVHPLGRFASKGIDGGGSCSELPTTQKVASKNRDRIGYRMVETHFAGDNARLGTLINAGRIIFAMMVFGGVDSAL